MSFAIFIIPFFIILIVVAGIYQYLKEQKRTEILRKYADSQNLNFHDSNVYKFEGKYPGFDFLKQGENRYAFNIISGKLNDFEVTGFDYHYETTSTDSDGDTTTEHHYFSAIVISSSFRLKAMSIRPEGLFDKMAAAFGWDDIDFESAEFSRKFHVKAEDRRWAYDALPPSTIEYLLKAPRHELHMHLKHLAVRGKTRFKPREFKKAFEMGKTMLNGIPPFAR